MDLNWSLLHRVRLHTIAYHPAEEAVLQGIIQITSVSAAALKINK